MNIFKKLFKSKTITDTKLYKLLGKEVCIMNGVGYGFIYYKDIYHNGYLKIGFGRTVSGYGDWGGGFDRSSTCPIWMEIDRNLVIQSAETDSFYNSDHSKKMERIAEKMVNNIIEGETKLEIEDEFLKKGIEEIFKIIPCKHVISWDVFESSHMLEHYTNVEERGEYDIEDSRSLNYIQTIRNDNIKKILKR